MLSFPVDMLCPDTGRWFRTGFRSDRPDKLNAVFEDVSLSCGSCGKFHPAETMQVRIGDDGIPPG